MIKFLPLIEIGKETSLLKQAFSHCEFLLHDIEQSEITLATDPARL